MKKSLLIATLILVMGMGLQLMAQERLKFTGMKDGKTMTDTDVEMSAAHDTVSDVMIDSGRYEMINSAGGVGGGISSGGKWEKMPDFISLSADKDCYFELECTVDESGSVVNVVITRNEGAPASLVVEVKKKMLTEAKYSSGHPGIHKMAFKIGR